MSELESDGAIICPLGPKTAAVVAGALALLKLTLDELAAREYPGPPRDGAE